MNSPPVLCGVSREKTAIFPEHMNSRGEFMCSGKIAVLSLLAPHKTWGEFMCIGKIAFLSLLAPHKTGGEFMYSGKIAVLSATPFLCGASRERTAIFPEIMNSPPVLFGVSKRKNCYLSRTNELIPCFVWG
jgi:hypothetical protein